MPTTGRTTGRTTGFTAGEAAHRRLIAAAGALLLMQVVHGATPAKTTSEGYVGLVAGLVALVANVVALVGLTRRRPWAPRLAGVTGVVVSVGFVLYHGIP